MEGLATCCDNAGMEADIDKGDVFYVREIPNMSGHVLAIRQRDSRIWVGLHLERFELTNADD